MLPFVRMLEYGNNVVPKKIVKFSAQNQALFILFDDGRLFGRGLNNAYQMGTGDTNSVLEWRLISTDVADFHTIGAPLIVRKRDETWWICGRAFIFGDRSTIYTTLTDVTDKLGVLSSGYDELYVNSNTIWYRKDSTYYRMGLSATNCLLNGSGPDITTFTAAYTPDVKKLFPADQGVVLSYNDGTVFSVGQNTGGKFCLPLRQAYPNLTNISAVLPEVTKVDYCTSCTFFHTVQGLYACGNVYGGQIGNGQTDINTYVLSPPYKISSELQNVISNGEGGTLRYTPVNGLIQYSGSGLRFGMGLNADVSRFSSAPNIGSNDFYVGQTASYYIVNSEVIYAAGQPGSYALIPGHVGTQLNFVQIELPK